jgi:ubiquinone/menaquinone biosynthesis C-methylase UbiE
VGAYERWVFNPLMELNLGRPSVVRQRTAALQPARGRVLEVGLGTGMNLPHLPANITTVAAVGPPAEPDARARQRARERGLTLDYRSGLAEALPFSDAAFDTVVCTFVLCTVGDPLAALAEFRRVLDPEGQLLFLEHGPSRRPLRRALQRAIERPHRVVACGCSLVRPTETTIVAAGFDLRSVTHEDVQGVAFPYRDMVRGIARPVGLRGSGRDG